MRGFGFLDWMNGWGLMGIGGGVENWQNVDTTTMMFPSEFLIDYVRVYQRKGYTNVGCDPKEYPTASYINAHPAAYGGECWVCFLGGGGADVGLLWGRSECDGVDVSVAEEPIGGSWFCFFVGGVLMRFLGFVVRRRVLMQPSLVIFCIHHSRTCPRATGLKNSLSYSFICAGRTARSGSVAPVLTAIAFAFARYFWPS